MMRLAGLWQESGAKVAHMLNQSAG